MASDFREMIVKSYAEMHDKIAALGGTSQPSRLLAMRHMREEVRRYDIRGGQTMRLKVQLPHEHVGPSGSQFKKLGKGLDWNSMVTRGLMPSDEFGELFFIIHQPFFRKHYDGSQSMVMDQTWLKGRSQRQYYRELSPLFHAMKYAALALGMYTRTGADSPLLLLSPDLVKSIFDGAELLNIGDAMLGGPSQSTAVASIGGAPLADDDARTKLGMGAALKMLKDHRAQQDVDGRVAGALELKSAANRAFAEKSYEVAVTLYAQALQAVGAQLCEDKTP